MTIMEQDALARTQITSEINRNFFVEAAAGSGKTSSLVDRMIAMVGAGIDVSKICAITFTKAAAKEFYGRFQKQLMERSSDDKTDAVLRTRYAEALRNIDLCFMGTIDSFSDMLLHEHPLEAGMPSETKVCSDNDAKPQYLAEYARIKCGEYGESLRKKYELFRAAQTNADNVFANCIGIFTERREADFVYTPPENIDINTQYTNWKYRLLLTLNRLQKHQEYQFTGRSNSSKEAWSQLPKHISVLHNSWNHQIGDVLSALKKLGDLRLGKDRNGQLLTPEAIDAELPEVFELHEGSPSYYYLNLVESDVYKTLKKLQYAATMDFLVSASKEIAKEMRRNGTMTFHDALLTLRDLLKYDAATGGRLIRHIANRHRFYLVDEFQDTDPLQAEVVFYLAAQEPQPDWTACVPRAGSLFIVGDPKQSIYRFRGADVSSFLRVRSMFKQGAGEVLTLSRNFRSTVKLQTMFNDVFPEMLEEIENVQSGYHPIPIDETKADDLTTGIYTYPVHFDNKLVDDGEQLVEVIRRLIGNPAVRLKDGKPPQFRDIMIITYRKGKIAAFAKQLTAAGIPVHVEGKINLAECPALNAVVELFAAVSAPVDTMSVYKALISAAFCIPYDMIHDYCSLGGKLSAYYENEDMLSQYPAIRNALERIKNYANDARSNDSAALLQKITDGEKLLAKTGSASLEYYCYAVELLRKKESDGEILNHADAAAYLRKLLTESGEERCVSLSPDDNRVHIANLHKVKGLQAPIVILAEPNAKDFDPTLRQVHDPEKTECRVFKLQYTNPKTHVTITYAETEQFPDDWINESQCMTAEKERLLYVAATRAENILIIGDSVKEKDGSRYDGNPWQAFLPYAEGTVAACIPENSTVIPVPKLRTDADALYEQAAAQSVLAEPSVSEPTYSIVRPSQIKLKSVTAEDSDDIQEQTPIDRNAALTGTLVHRLMECIVSGGVPEDTSMLISAILREYDADAEIYAPLLQKVLKRMTIGGYPQESGFKADLLAILRQADEVYCEVPFCQKRESEIVHGIIDLLYRCGDVWQIIDFKTNAERIRLAEKYSAQLAAYTEAVREIAGVEAQAKIYHIDI